MPRTDAHWVRKRRQDMPPVMPRGVKVTAWIHQCEQRLEEAVRMADTGLTLWQV